MFTTRHLWSFCLVFLSCVLLAACLSTDVKKVGRAGVDESNNGETDSDSLTITLAYRDDSADGRVVSLKGLTSLSSAKISNVCGLTGSNCTCKFYTSTADTAPVGTTAGTLSLSDTNNAVTCTIAGAVDPDDYSHMQLVTTDTSLRSTGFIEIKTNLEVKDVIGDLDDTKVTTISRYPCRYTFLEGEGVSPVGNSLSCVASQRLGTIGATYNYYLSSKGADGIDRPHGDVPFQDLVCKNGSLMNVSCQRNAVDKRYGLYTEAAFPFVRAVNLVAAPAGTNASPKIFGYAADPDSKGNCAPGLTKVQLWQATPQSIIQNSLPGGNNPPSNFVNTGNLDSFLLEAAQPANFVVDRQANSTTCAAVADSDGIFSCAAATFGALQPNVQSVTYLNTLQALCVIPKEVL